MLILKHVGYEITDRAQLESLLTHLRETTSQVKGVIFKEIYFMNGKNAGPGEAKPSEYVF